MTFSGRAARSQYWYFVLFNFLGGLILGAFDAAVLNAPEGLLSNIFALALLLPNIAVAVRRLHDLNKSGWWLLIALVPVLGTILLIYWFCQRGTAGDNQYGADPLGGQALPPASPHAPAPPPAPPSQSQQL